MRIELEAIVTCPMCGIATRERMPDDACAFFRECPSCGAVIRPEKGDCCVYCSYGSVPCPPVQRNSTDVGRPPSIRDTCRPSIRDTCGDLR